MTIEQTINIEAVRTTPIRATYGGLKTLARSIREEGLRHPVTLWTDGTLLSGHRRHRACLLLAADRIPAVYVDTIEAAAKQFLGDNEDDHLAMPMRWTEVCHLWALMRRLDKPDAILRADAHRRRGVELRRQTYAGVRQPGRSRQHSEDYVLKVLGPPFGISESTARRLWAVYSIATGLTDAPDDKRERAREALATIDRGDNSISASYERLMQGRSLPAAPRVRPAETVEPAAAKVQRTAWDRSLPQMEGLVAGLVELGPPNAELTWEQVEPVRTRLMQVRRDLEKMIRKMKETTQP